MINKLRVRAQSESGFTLVELLVVMLILGLLAAIAIPSFFNQRDKARDADAKSVARTSQTAMETYATDHQGSYVGADFAALTSIENTLTGETVAVTGVDGTGVPAAKEYRVTATSSTGNTFWISRASTGVTALGCATANSGGCPDGGNWGG